MELVYQVVCERKCFWASTISDSEGCHRPLSDGQILQAKKKKGKKFQMLFEQNVASNVT